MADRPVGSLWIGGELSWMEQLSLKSYLDKGQDVTLFHYGEIVGVPEGVKLRDGREVIDTDDFIKYKTKDSFALFADWFRLHMIAKNPGMIWIDTDVYCWQPMTYEHGDVFGLELYGKSRINNAVLGFDPDSEILKAMIEFTEDRYPIPSFINKKRQVELIEAKNEGNPIHVSELPWGVWGPLMVTHFVQKFDAIDRALPVEAFYPVTFPDRRFFLRRPELALKLITKDTTALHLWASTKKRMGYHFDGLPPKGSFYEMLCISHDIDPSKAPIKSRGVHIFDSDDE